MADGPGGEKTEKATPKRRSDERKKGNVFTSKDVATVVSLVVMFYVLKLLGANILSILKETLIYMIEYSANVKEITDANIGEFGLKAMINFLLCTMPLLFIGIGVSIVATGTQTRFLMSGALLKPKFSRMNPLNGIKNMFSLRSLVELLKSILKIIALTYIVYSTLSGIFSEVPRLFDVEPLEGARFLAQTIMKLVTNVTYLFLFIAAADWGYQYWDYEKNLKMTKQEIKEEYKQMEGDPQVKGKIKERQRAMSQRRMMQDVPKADVIVRNPTHYAVAIKYEQGKDRAPIVLAKGKDLIALKIVEIAEKNDIITTENVPLARGLYEAVEIGQEIPEKFYVAVAEVLAYVYKLKKKG